MPRESERIIGKKFNRLTAIERIYDDSGCVKYLFRCDCGKEKVIKKYSVVNGLTKSCGCLSNEKVRNRSFKNLKGQVFGRLTVISINHTTRLGTYWNCVCECGNECVVLTTKLSNGHTTSCGCRKDEIKRDIEKLNKSHGKSKTKLYKIFSGMKARCYRKSCPNYNRYGGRGIIICKEWLDSFENFYNWSISNGYKSGLSIDRIDNDKGYSPDNCRWVSAKEQANNTRSTVFLTYKGETKSASEWSEITGIRQATIVRRKTSYGWTDEECLTIKIGEKRV